MTDGSSEMTIPSEPLNERGKIAGCGITTLYNQATLVPIAIVNMLS